MSSYNFQVTSNFEYRNDSTFEIQTASPTLPEGEYILQLSSLPTIKTVGQNDITIIEFPFIVCSSMHQSQTFKIAIFPPNEGDPKGDIKKAMNNNFFAALAFVTADKKYEKGDVIDLMHLNPLIRFIGTVKHRKWEKNGESKLSYVITKFIKWSKEEDNRIRLMDQARQIKVEENAVAENFDDELPEFA